MLFLGGLKSYSHDSLITAKCICCNKTFSLRNHWNRLTQGCNLYLFFTLIIYSYFVYLNMTAQRWQIPTVPSLITLHEDDEDDDDDDDDLLLADTHVFRSSVSFEVAVNVKLFMTDLPVQIKVELKKFIFRDRFEMCFSSLCVRLISTSSSLPRHHQLFISLMLNEGELLIWIWTFQFVHFEGCSCCCWQVCCHGKCY